MAGNHKNTKRKILISGAGIAGLTTALCLAQRGFQIEIIEKARQLDPVGAGLQVSPNAYSVLASLGLHQSIQAVATYPEGIHIKSGSSAGLLTTIPLGDHVQMQFGQPYCFIHRADLQAILLAECEASPRVNICYGCEATNVEFGHDTTTLTAEPGDRKFFGEAVVAADGVWSNLRIATLKLPQPRYSGRVAWRALVSGAELEGSELLQDSHLWLAPSSHAVTYPVRKCEQLNVIVISHSEIPDQQPGLRPDLSAFSNFGQRLCGILEQQANCSFWPIFESPAPVRMGRSNLALVGDAAHAMLPFAAQGAAMAIEDAAVLADCLSRLPASEAIAEFEALRKPRVERVMALARSNGWIYHLGLPVSPFRNLAMRILPAKMLLNRQAWIYGWQPPVLTPGS